MVRTADPGANAVDATLGAAEGARLAVATGDAVISDCVGSTDGSWLAVGDGSWIAPEAARGAGLGCAARQPARAIKTMTAKAVVARWNDLGRRWCLMPC
jgi:hypothetical protein